MLSFFSGKLQALEVSSSSKASETVQMIEEINAAKIKSMEDLNLANIQIETISKNLTDLETELETLKPLKVKTFVEHRPSQWESEPIIWQKILTRI